MSKTIMAKEAAETPHVIIRQLANNQAICEQLGEHFRQQPPRAIMMIGRGTSDHAGVYAKYLFEVGCQVPVIAAAPSVAGVYNAQLNLEGCVAIVISQSGKSPDILHQAKLAKAGGAYLVALVNDTTSPLAELVDAVVPLSAGEEKAVAATKSYLATLSALLHLYSCWKQDADLRAALEQLPQAMLQAQQAPARLTAEGLSGVQHCVVLGRGFGYAIGREVALKLKEVLSVHAEAFSSAEFLHGPVTLVEKKLCIINITIDDESATVHSDQLTEVAKRGARVIDISLSSDTHPRLAALPLMQRFYLDIEQVAAALGLNPDAPPGLKKVTETV